ncbi:MAG TPA: DUF3108 domain-containing protein, partial [Bacteroidota bacterium]|nr:DUF3108 domain-containing protein [Bacteroidota bacterium]
FFLSAISLAMSDGDQLSAPDSMFRTGEELTYNVSYASFDIGRIRIKVTDSFVRDNKTYYKASAYIDSYSGVPLVDLHAVYSSVMDQSVYSTWFSARDKENNRWREWTYIFDYPDSSVTIQEGFWKQKNIIKSDTLHLDTLSQDGLSLFFLARKFLFKREIVNIPTLVKEKRGMTVIEFTGDRTSEKIEAVPYPVDLIHFRGKAGFVGVFGVTGDFEGWFSNDAARVPVLAKMKVLIGNVRIELTEWKRTGWMPPKYAKGVQ